MKKILDIYKKIEYYMYIEIESTVKRQSCLR